MTITGNHTAKGYEYKNKVHETPFETFLRYSDEKERSSAKLAEILQEGPLDSPSILDIGTGTGEYLALSLSKVSDLTNPQLTLIEPSVDLVKHLKGQFPGLAPQVLNIEFEQFTSNEKFDVVLASHIFYHFTSDSWPRQLERMLSYLKPHGRLIIVGREEDDTYELKSRFKPVLLGKGVRVVLNKDVLAALPRKTTVSHYRAESQLTVPLDDSLEDTIAIVEFFINKEWSEIPEQIQRDITDFISSKQSIMRQIDDLAVVERA